MEPKLKARQADYLNMWNQVGREVANFTGPPKDQDGYFRDVFNAFVRLTKLEVSKACEAESGLSPQLKANIRLIEKYSLIGEHDSELDDYLQQIGTLNCVLGKTVDK